MKDGREYSSPIFMWRPEQGWFSLIDGPAKIFLKDVESAVTPGGGWPREGGAGKTEDELERAKRHGWDGK